MLVGTSAKVEWQFANLLASVKSFALRMTWNKHPPKVHRIMRGYKNEKPVTKAEMAEINSRLIRSQQLTKYDVTIKPNEPVAGKVSSAKRLKAL